MLGFNELLYTAPDISIFEMSLEMSVCGADFSGMDPEEDWD